MKQCPHCLSEIPEDARFCRYCGQRVEGKDCPDCGARAWREARVCASCGFQFKSEATLLDFQPFSVKAALLPTLLQRGRLLPQKIDLSREKIVVSTPGVFNLSQRDEEIPWNKVAGFDYRSGIFWDAVRIETRGQSDSLVPCLNKADGARIRAILRQLEN